MRRKNKPEEVKSHRYNEVGMEEFYMNFMADRFYFFRSAESYVTGMFLRP